MQADIEGFGGVFEGDAPGHEAFHTFSPCNVVRPCAAGNFMPAIGIGCL